MAAVVDLNGILDSIASHLTSANTTTASPVDISNGMSTRVQFVGTVHPMRVMIQPSKYPFVTCYMVSKSIQGGDIATSQIQAKRWGEVTIEVVGAVWNNNISTITQDPADRDCNKLMENVELSLRNLPNISGKVTWQVPEGTKYYDSVMEENHLRAGILTLTGKVYY